MRQRTSGEAWRASGRLPGALDDLLFRRRPRFLRNPEGPVIPGGVDPLEGAIAAVLDMRGTTLCVQGPPGSGKTYTGARMIVALLRAGKRVGITSNSHRAINLLLAEVCRVAADAGLPVDAVKVANGDDHMAGLRDGFRRVDSGRELFSGGRLPQLIGGTAFALSRMSTPRRRSITCSSTKPVRSLGNLVAIAAAARTSCCSAIRCNSVSRSKGRIRVTAGFPRSITCSKAGRKSQRISGFFSRGRGVFIRTSAISFRARSMRIGSVRAAYGRTGLDPGPHPPPWLARRGG